MNCLTFKKNKNFFEYKQQHQGFSFAVLQNVYNVFAFIIMLF